MVYVHLWNGNWWLAQKWKNHVWWWINFRAQSKLCAGLDVSYQSSYYFTPSLWHLNLWLRVWRRTTYFALTGLIRVFIFMEDVTIDNLIVIFLSIDVGFPRVNSLKGGQHVGFGVKRGLVDHKRLLVEVRLYPTHFRNGLGALNLQPIQVNPTWSIHLHP